MRPAKVPNYVCTANTTASRPRRRRTADEFVRYLTKSLVPFFPMFFEVFSELMRKSEQTNRALWEAYAATRNRAVRNELVETYLPMARSVAERLWQRLPKDVELDDLVSAGTLGLMDAVEAFDLSRGQV